MKHDSNEHVRITDFRPDFQIAVKTTGFLNKYSKKPQVWVYLGNKLTVLMYTFIFIYMK